MNRSNLRRLLAPRHIAVVGGDAAAEAVRQSRRIGFTGAIRPVHPRRTEIEGLPCWPDVAALPEAPDAALVAVPPEATVRVVDDLAGRGTGGVVCYAAGFAEEGGPGEERQRELVSAAGDTALIGPNCIGVLNYLDGAALWPDQHGGHPVDSGVAVITQSGNVGQNMTMQRRNLPLAQLVTVGNSAVTGVAELIEAMLDDERITAIGLYLEGIDDVAGLSRAATKALRSGVPLVALKSGRSEIGARVNLGHTSSLAGSDVLSDALFERLGIARVHRVDVFLETLKFLHVHGALPGARIGSASCSGGEASLVADAAHERGVELPALPREVSGRLRAVLGESVQVSNPLDYHTYIWGDRHAQAECFTGFLDAGFDAHLLMLDFPREDQCESVHWQTTVDAYLDAHRRTRTTACVVSSLPESMPPSVAGRLLAEGIAPMQGMEACLEAVTAARSVGLAQRAVDDVVPPDGVLSGVPEQVSQLDEWAGKKALAEFGLPIPRGILVEAHETSRVAEEIGFPVVAKSVSDSIAHKSEVGGVHVGLAGTGQLDEALARMSGLADRFLVESMVSGAVAELVVGVHRDPQFGPALTLGAGGVLVELVRDTATLLLPVSRDQIRAALRSLRSWPLLTGFRNRKAGDVEAAVEAVMAVADYARAHADRLIELDVNPLLVLPDGHGVVAVDALIRLGEPTEGDE